MTIPRNTPKPIVVQAESVVAKIQAGATMADVKAHYMRHDRRLVSVPIGYRYRLLCRAEKTGMVPIELMTHEAYNRVCNYR